MLRRPQRSCVARLDETVLLCIDQIGIENTIRALKGEIKKNQSLHNSDALYIVNLVSEVLDISEREIFSGTGRKNDRRYALGFCTYYLHHVYKYDMEEVRYMLRKNNEWAIYKYSALIERLNPQHNSDKKYIEIKKVLDVRVHEHVKRNKKKKRNEKNKRAGATSAAYK